MARVRDVVSDLERKHILSILEKDGTRLDGRKLMDTRPVRLVLNFGEMLMKGTAEQVMASEKVKSAYFGSEGAEEIISNA